MIVDAPTTAPVPPATASPDALPDDLRPPRDASDDPAQAAGVMPVLQSVLQPLWNAIVARFDDARGAIGALGGNGRADAAGAVPVGTATGTAPALPAAASQAAAPQAPAESQAPADLNGLVPRHAAADPGGRAASPWTDPADRYASDAGTVVPLLQPPLGRALPAPHFDDVVAFTQETARLDAAALPLEPLAAELAAAAAPDRVGGAEACTFDFEVPGFGRLEGRVSVRAGHASVELQALQPAAASALRQRLHQLQHLVDRETDGGVTLSLVG